MKTYLLATILLLGTASAQYPVKVENCGNTLTFDQAPERVITTYSVTTEFMLRLGLEAHIVGAASFGEPLPEDLQPAYVQLNLIGADYLLPREVTLSLEPDFVFDNLPSSVYDGSRGNATREELTAAGAQLYSLTAQCEGYTNPKVEDIYTDLENIGRIFNVPERAAEVVREMQETIAGVQTRIEAREPLQTLIYEGGEGPFAVYGTGPWDAVLRLAGGENAIADLDTPFAQLNAEEIATREVDVIAVIDYDGQAEARAEQLRELFPNTAAVQNDRIFTIDYVLINPGIRAHRGIEAFARGLYPEVYE